MNIVWQQPNGNIAITTILDNSNSQESAKTLLTQGDIPVDWIAVAFNYAEEYPSTPQGSWIWDGNAIVTSPVWKPTLSDISKRQIRQALTKIDLRQQVEDAVSASNQDTKDWWNYSDYYERNHPAILAMQSVLQVSDEQVDALWVLAGSL